MPKREYEQQEPKHSILPFSPCSSDAAETEDEEDDDGCDGEGAPRIDLLLLKDRRLACGTASCKLGKKL